MRPPIAAALLIQDRLQEHGIAAAEARQSADLASLIDRLDLRGAFVAGGAMAQTGTSPPPAQNGPQNSAINSSTKAVEAPVQGRNSFTEGEAKSRIEKSGFSNVSALAKDDNGIWRGKAMKNGKSSEVSLDFQGNVIAR